MIIATGVCVCVFHYLIYLTWGVLALIEHLPSDDLGVSDVFVVETATAMLLGETAIHQRPIPCIVVFEEGRGDLNKLPP